MVKLTIGAVMSDKNEKPKKREVKWVGSAPTCCDLCNSPIKTHFIDGAVRGHGWANMCLKCHATYGAGFGTGRGQRYERREDGWYKVAG